LEILTRAMERTKFWVKGFKDIRLLVIEEVLQELELTSNAMLAEVGLVDWRISYVIERETKAGTTSRGLNVSILSPKSRDAVKWESWSGGEGQRLRMVGALALSEVLLDHVGIQPDFEVLDEPTQHLSAEGVRDLCDFLAVRAEQLERRTFYIDHMAVESAQFSSTTTIEKDADGSHILRTPRSA
jgi:DNA repair exonuclease SbcCD ATPase subunit